MKLEEQSSLTLIWQTLIVWETLFTILELYRKKFRVFLVLFGFTKKVLPQCCGQAGKWLCCCCNLYSLVKAKGATPWKPCVCELESKHCMPLDDMRACVLKDWKCLWLQSAIIQNKRPRGSFSDLHRGTSNKTQTIKYPPATKTHGMFFYIIFHIKCNCRLTFIEKIFIQARYA